MPDNDQSDDDSQEGNDYARVPVAVDANIFADDGVESDSEVVTEDVRVGHLGAPVMLDISPHISRVDRDVIDSEAGASDQVITRPRSGSSSQLRAMASYVPACVAEHFIRQANTAVEGQPADGPVVEVFRAVVMFCDLSGFTALSEALQKRGQEGAELLKSVLNTIFTELTITIVDKYGGDVIKFAGDAMLVVWRSTDGELSAASAAACECSLTLIDQLAEMNQSIMTQTEGVSMGLHIGIGLGDCHGLHVGGERDRAEYLLMGEPLHQMGHAEKAANNGELVVSQEVVQALRKCGAVSIDHEQAVLGDQQAHAAADPEPLSNDGATQPASADRRTCGRWEATWALPWLLGTPVPEKDKEGEGMMRITRVGGEKSTRNNADVGNLENDAVRRDIILSKLVSLGDTSITYIQESVQRYIPRAVRSKISFDVFRNNGINALDTTVSGNYVGEFRRVSVLFVNIVGLGPEKPELVHAVFLAIQRYIYLVEGSVNKFLMDDKGVTAVCCLGLPPLQHPNDAALAVKAALLIVPALEKMPGITVAIGVSSGRVFCGEVGSLIRREYTLLGTTVNLAARLMQKCLTSGLSSILCDQVTRDACVGRFLFTEHGQERFKGYARPLPVFSPTETQQAIVLYGFPKLIESTRVAVDEYPHFVGRPPQLDVAKAMVKDSKGGIMLVTGDQGTGKTAFLRELHLVAVDHQLHGAFGTCSAPLRHKSFGVWVPIILGGLGIDEARLPKEPTREDFELEISACPVQVDTTVKADLISVLLEWCHFDDDPQPVEALSLQQLDDALDTVAADMNQASSSPAASTKSAQRVQTMVACLEAICTADTAPRLAVIFDDVHWMDEESWVLSSTICTHSTLKSCVTQVLSYQSMLYVKKFLSCRIQKCHDILLEQAGSTHFYSCQPMRLGDIRELVSRHLASMDNRNARNDKSETLDLVQLEDEALDHVHHKAEGSPFYSKAVITGLVKNGYVVKLPKSREFVVAPRQVLTDCPIPDDVQTQVLSKIESLNATEQWLVRCCATFGHLFPFECLEAVSAECGNILTANQVYQTLQELVQHEILLPWNREDRESALPVRAQEARDELWMPSQEGRIIHDPTLQVWKFRQAIVQEVVYDNMLFDLRRKTHMAIASWLRAKYVRTRSDFQASGATGHHLRRAGQKKDAVYFLAKAGRRALELEHLSDAACLLEQALALHNVVHRLSQLLPEGDQAGNSRSTGRLGRWRQSSVQLNTAAPPTLEREGSSSSTSSAKEGETRGRGSIANAVTRKGSISNPIVFTSSSDNDSPLCASVLLALAETSERAGGELLRAKAHIVECLRLLGKEEASADTSVHKKGTIKRITGYRGHKSQSVVLLPQSEEAMQINVAEAYCTMAHVHYASGDRDPFVYWAEKGASKCSKYTLPPNTKAVLLATHLFALSSVSKNHDVQRAEITTKLRQILPGSDYTTQAFVNHLFAVIDSGMGQWESAMEYARDAMALVPPKGYLHARLSLVLAMAFFCTGRLEEGLETFRALTEECPLLSYGCWSTVGLSLQGLFQHNELQMLEDLKRIKERLFKAYLELTKPVIMSIESMAYWQLNCLPPAGSNEVDRRGWIRRAVDLAVSVVELCDARFPLDYKMLLPLNFAGEVLNGIFECSSGAKMEDNPYPNNVLLEQLNSLQSAFQKFKHVYRIGKPGYTLLKGRILYHRNQTKPALEVWLKGVKFAKENGLVYDEAMLLFELYRKSPGSSQKHRYLADCKALFRRMGHTFMLERLEHLSRPRRP